MIIFTRETTYLFLGTRMGWAWYYPFPMPQQTLSTYLPNPGRTLSAQGTCANVHYVLAQPVGFCGGGRNLSMCKFLGWKNQQRHYLDYKLSSSSYHQNGHPRYPGEIRVPSP